LNDRIRNLLLSYDFSKSTDPLQEWASHLTTLLGRKSPKTTDLTVTTSSGATFELHRFILSARSPYFYKKLVDTPETTTWKLPPTIPVDSFTFVLRYLYLGDLPKDVVGPDSRSTEEEVFKGIDKLCKHLEIEKLWEAVLSANDRRLARQRYQDEVARAQRQVEETFRGTVMKYKMVVDTDKVDKIKWPHHNAMFADCILRADVEEETGDATVTTETTNGIGIPIGPPAASSDPAPAKKRKRSVLYPVHKAFLIRSPYFETMFSSQFREAQESEHLHIIKMDCIPEVLEIVLNFLYTEKADISLDLALDVLYVSDMLLLDKLKTKAAQAISTLGSGSNVTVTVDKSKTKKENGKEEVEVEPINVYDVIHAAWDLNVQRLEDFVARYLADRLEDYIDEPDFSELIQESALRLKARQETDTIELLDDIRYYLNERFRLRFEDAGVDDMMQQDEVDPHVAEHLRPRFEDDDPEAIKKETELDGQAAAVGAKMGANSAGGVGELTGEEEGAVQTLDGRWAEDELARDAINYQILLDRIDAMLEKLKLDA
jgi:ankyrin repeat/BTB/POZ domain-containing protein 1